MLTPRKYYFEVFSKLGRVGVQTLASSTRQVFVFWYLSQAKLKSKSIWLEFVTWGPVATQVDSWVESRVMLSPYWTIICHLERYLSLRRVPTPDSRLPWPWVIGECWIFFIINCQLSYLPKFVPFRPFI